MPRSLFRHLLFILLALSVAAAPLHAAPQPGRSYRLLILDSQAGNPYDEIRSALLQRLAALGYREGANLTVALHTAGNDVARGEELLRREVPKGYDAVFVGGTAATIAARQALFDTPQPVVFGAPTDPVGIGVIDAFDAPPKANFTGVSYPVPVKARLRFLRQLLPQARTFGLIYADMPQSRSYNAWLRDLLEHDPEFRDLRFLFRPVPLVTGEDGDARMAELALPLIAELDGQVDAFLKPNDQMGTRQPFAEAVWAHAGKPLIGLVKNDVMAGWGAAAAVFPSHQSIGEQAATMIGELFDGRPVSTMPPQWPTKFGYAVDLPRCRKFGITVPVGLLQLAGANIVRQ